MTFSTATDGAYTSDGEEIACTLLYFIADSIFSVKGPLEATIARLDIECVTDEECCIMIETTLVRIWF